MPRKTADNTVQVTGKEWARHRRISAAPFNERIHKIVWDEAVYQTRQLSHYWNSHGANGFSSTLQDINTVTLNVFAKASLGSSWDFCSADDRKRRIEIEGEFSAQCGKMTWTYRDSLFFVTHNIVAYVMIPDWVLCAPVWSIPPPLKRFVTAWKDLGEYFRIAVKKTKAELANGKMEQNPSVISYLVSKSDEVQREGLERRNDPSQYFTDSDIYGTLFALNQTGHDTSKSVLGSALYLLAAHPEWEDWLHEEISSIDPAGEKPYGEVFNKSKRCLAIMVSRCTLNFTTMQSEGLITGVW